MMPSLLWWVASAAVRREEGLDELLGPEGAKVVQLLSDADVAERNPQLFCNPDDDAPPLKSRPTSSG